MRGRARCNRASSSSSSCCCLLAAAAACLLLLPRHLWADNPDKRNGFQGRSSQAAKQKELGTVFLSPRQLPGAGKLL
jgi:hypothetical protein